MSKISAKKAKELEQATYTRDILFDAKRDMNPYWRSSLFSEVYLKNDIPREYKHIWEHDEIADETSGFFKFYDGFLDLVNKHENSSFDTWKEAETVKNWIVPIMVLLGWDTDSKTEDSYYVDNESFTVTEKEKKQTYRPDLLYFEKPNHKTYTQNQTDSDKKLAEARDKKTGCKIVVEAKYWNKLSQKQTDSKKDKKLDDSAVGLGPDLQTLKYMEILELDFGVLTDGKTWKLFHKELSQGVDRRNYTFDLDRLRELALDVSSHGNEEKYKHYAKYFYYFFSKQSFVQGKSKTSPFVYEVFNYSKKYASRIEEDLKKRFIITMGLTCNALKNSCQEQGENIDLVTIRNVAESHIFNFLFVKSCEVRHVLPIRSIEYLKVSLHEVIESLDAMKFDLNKEADDYFSDFQHGSTFGGNKFTYDGYQIFDRFINLYEIIHDGTNKSNDFGFEIEGFKESIFSKDEWRFAKKHKIKNSEMIKILFTLNFIESEFQGRKFQQIPYSYFTPRQLGSIYESFLEYRLEMAETGMIFNKGQWQKANLNSNQVRNLNLVDSNIVKKGDLFFSPDNTDRKMTGSYYTPDYIVKYIVENTLDPLIRKKSSKEILELRICDPAMGSGHFLAGALDYLVSSYRKKWGEENNDDIPESTEETARLILDSCLFGVDINSRAVKLAQMSLWLMTAFPGKKLERLTDQMKVGNSIINETSVVDNALVWKKEFKDIFSKGGFDAIVGNPPYGANIDKWSDYFKTRDEEVIKNYLEIYKIFISRSISLLKDTATLGVIVPNTFIAQPRYKDLRSHLLKFNVIEIANLGDNVFTGVVVPTAILILSKSKPNAYIYKDYSSRQKNEAMFIEETSETVKTSDVLKTTDYSLMPIQHCDEDTFLMDEVCYLKDAGIQYHRSGIGLKNKGGNDLYERLFSENKNAFKNHIKVWYGKLIRDYHIEKDTDEYFNLDYKKILKPNESASFSLDAFNVSEKIIWRQTAPYIIAAYDDKRRWFRNTIQCGWVKEQYADRVRLKYILALVNSKYFKFLYMKIVNEAAGKVFPQVKLTHIKKLPVKIISLEKQDKIIKLVDQLSNTNDQVTKTKIKEQIDELVYKIYGLSSDIICKIESQETRAAA